MYVYNLASETYSYANLLQVWIHCPVSRSVLCPAAQLSVKLYIVSKGGQQWKPSVICTRALSKMVIGTVKAYPSEALHKFSFSVCLTLRVPGQVFSMHQKVCLVSLLM